MDITKRDLDDIYAKHKAEQGGVKEDYFALLYLTREFEKTPDQVSRHIAFGEDVPEGINAFHVDVNRRNLYLFQFQWSAQHQAFKEPLRRLAREGMERIFGPAPETPGRLLAELRDRLHEDQAAIDKVLIHFVYNGDPADADQSAALDALREDLEAKKHLIDRCFEGRNVTLTFQFISNETRGPRVGSHTRTTHRYELALPQVIASETETGEQLHVGFVQWCPKRPPSLGEGTACDSRVASLLVCAREPGHPNERRAGRGEPTRPNSTARAQLRAKVIARLRR